MEELKGTANEEVRETVQKPDSVNYDGRAVPVSEYEKMMNEDGGVGSERSN